MDYLLSREKTSSQRSNPWRARSILVDCGIMKLRLRQISTDNLHSFGFVRRQDISVCNTMNLTFDLHYSVLNTVERAPLREALFLIHLPVKAVALLVTLLAYVLRATESSG